MADVVWPVGLPIAPLVNRLSESPPDLLVRTPMDQGPAKLRRRLTAGIRPLKGVELIFTRTQVATFDSFYVTSCKGGALSFEFKNPRLGTTVDARFTSIPIYTPLAPRQNGTVDKWTVSFDLEILPSAPAPPAAPPVPSDAGVLAMIDWHDEEPVLAGALEASVAELVGIAYVDDAGSSSDWVPADWASEPEQPEPVEGFGLSIDETTTGGLNGPNGSIGGGSGPGGPQ